MIDAVHRDVLLEVGRTGGAATNNVAEYHGLLEAGGARTIDPDARLLVRMDSKLVVEQMAGRWKIKHPDLAGARRRGAGRACRSRRDLRVGAAASELAG